MALPAEFNHVEHLQSVLRQWVNRDVRDYFRTADDDEEDEDITTPRGSLKVACTHLDSDSLTMTQLRLQLFDRIRLQKVQVPYYGIPVSSFQEQRKFVPQLMLYFQEDIADVEPGFEPVTGEISFRLMDYNSQSLTPSVAEMLGNRVKTNFSLGGGYIWRKGKVMCSYSDWGKGYQLQLLCRTEAEGREVVNKVLDLQNDTPDWKKFNVNQNAEPAAAYPTLPELEPVFGKSRRMPRKRPIADVRFQYAVLNIHGLQNPQVLVDRSGTWGNPLVA